VHGRRSPADVIVDGQVVNASFDGERDEVLETGRRRTDSYCPTETSTCHNEWSSSATTPTSDDGGATCKSTESARRSSPMVCSRVSVLNSKRSATTRYDESATAIVTATATENPTTVSTVTTFHGGSADNPSRSRILSRRRLR